MMSSLNIMVTSGVNWTIKKGMLLGMAAVAVVYKLTGDIMVCLHLISY